MLVNEINGVRQIENGMNKGEIVGFTLGLMLFCVTMYAMTKAIKAHTLTIKKLNDEGYK